MLHFVSSSLFESPAQTLVNTVNTVGVMGKGIAAEFKKRYPDMFRRYRTYCKEGELDIGKLYLYRTANKWVLNFPTKKHWRHPSKLEYIEQGLAKFVDSYDQYGIKSISFPQLGTGNGGLPWETVRPIMERHLAPLPLPVYIHTASPPPGFMPEHLTHSKIVEYRKPRQGITLNDFFFDLAELGLFERWPLAEPGEDEPTPLPQLRLTDGDSVFVIPGEELVQLWGDLTSRGAVRYDHFPSSFAHHAKLVADLLTRNLQYISRIDFLEGHNKRVPGIRFTPASRQSLAPGEERIEPDLESLER
jgi:O-acetyl-ADP-ribose deacetylase (regulator of RNase III)